MSDRRGAGRATAPGNNIYKILGSSLLQLCKLGELARAAAVRTRDLRSLDQTARHAETDARELRIADWTACPTSDGPARPSGGCWPRPSRTRSARRSPWKITGMRRKWSSATAFSELVVVAAEPVLERRLATSGRKKDMLTSTRHPRAARTTHHTISLPARSAALVAGGSESSVVNSAAEDLRPRGLRLGPLALRGSGGGGRISGVVGRRFSCCASVSAFHSCLSSCSSDEDESSR